jgi:hypothetical protein
LDSPFAYWILKESREEYCWCYLLGANSFSSLSKCNQSFKFGREWDNSNYNILNSTYHPQIYLFLYKIQIVLMKDCYSTPIFDLFLLIKRKIFLCRVFRRNAFETRNIFGVPFKTKLFYGYYLNKTAILGTVSRYCQDIGKLKGIRKLWPLICSCVYSIYNENNIILKLWFRNESRFSFKRNYISQSAVSPYCPFL